MGVISAQSTKTISVHYDIAEFDIHSNSVGDVEISSRVYNLTFNSDTLQPALPLINCNILIPVGQFFSEYNYTIEKELVIENVTMAANPMDIPTNFHGQLPPVKKTSFASSRYPKKIINYTGEYVLDGYNIITFQICPFEYDANSKKLYLNTQIDIKIRLSNSSLNSGRNNVDKGLFEDFVKEFVINGNEMSSLYPSGTKRLMSITPQPLTNYDYVIVTSNLLKDVFQELAQWKTTKGVRAKVLTVEDIVTDYTGNDIQEKIKRALADIAGLKYVLLGGDTLQVPTRMCYITYDNETTLTPADVYYSCLSTIDWDSNNNGIYGELADNVNLTPSFVISRAPASNISQAQAFVDRIINYESAPDTTGWKDNILLCATQLSDPPSYKVVDGDTISDGHNKSENILYKKYISPYWHREMKRFYDTGTDFSGGKDYNFIAENIQQQLSNGYTLVDVLAHGNYNLWGVENGNYTSTFASTLSNLGYTIITTEACNTNAFDKNFGCLSKSLINNANSGILAYWGSSRLGWTSSNIDGEGISIGLNGLTYKELLSDKQHCLGLATIKAKVAYLSNASNLNNGFRWLFLSLNLLGDPEMPVYLSKPKIFSGIDIHCVNNNIIVNNQIDSINVCLEGVDNSEQYYVVKNVCDNQLQLTGLTGMFNVSITKPGYIPYISIGGDVSYLQDLTLTGSQDIKAHNLSIGSSVTNLTSDGPVVIQSGETSILNKGTVTISGEFEVDPGAVFEIIPNI